jgi:RNA polymerase sigma factor (sigma-70 family)
MLFSDIKATRTWNWSVAAAPRGVGGVLVACEADRCAAWVIAPPAVSLRVEESDEQRKQWRAARFVAEDAEELVIAVGEHVAGSYQHVTIEDVRAVAPPDLQDWITVLRDRQRALADGFGRQDPRVAPNEEHARAASRRFAELAGATESRRRACQELVDAVIEVPDTVAELLGRAKCAPRPRSLRRSDAAIGALVRQAISGDARAWEQLTDEFGGLVWSTARAYRLDAIQAAHVSQLTWLRLVEHLHRLDPPNVGAWLARTARRECVRMHSAAREVAGDETSEVISPRLQRSATPQPAERDRALDAALARMPQRDRELLEIFSADPTPSYAEIAAALAMPMTSIGPARARALRRLRREVTREGLDDDDLQTDHAPLVHIDVSKRTVQITQPAAQ